MMRQAIYQTIFIWPRSITNAHILWIIKINCPVIYIIEFYLTHYFNVEILLNMNIYLIKWLEVKATYFFITTLLKLRHRASHTNNCCLEIKITEMATVVIMVDSRPSYLSTIIKTCQSLHWHFSCSKYVMIFKKNIVRLKWLLRFFCERFIWYIMYLHTLYT